jgi:hypothetical protein
MKQLELLTIISDDQQFQLYQQSDQSPLTLTDRTQNKTKKTMTYDAGNPDPGFIQAHKHGRFKPVNGIPTFPS